MLTCPSANWSAAALVIAWHLHVDDLPWSKGYAFTPGIGEVLNVQSEGYTPEAEIYNREMYLAS